MTAIFMIIEFLEKDKPVASMLLFLISEFIEGIIGEHYKGKKQRTRELLVEVSIQQATKLLNENRIADLEIKVTPHRSLNSSQGVISKRDLAHEAEGDLLEGLRNQVVTAVKRITIKLD